MKKAAKYLRDTKAQSRHISMRTCYDYPTALWEEEAGVDVMLVGDSVGTNVLGANAFELRHSRKYEDFRGRETQAMGAYVQDVHSRNQSLPNNLALSEQ